MTTLNFLITLTDGKTISQPVNVENAKTRANLLEVAQKILLQISQIGITNTLDNETMTHYPAHRIEKIQVVVPDQKVELVTADRMPKPAPREEMRRFESGGGQLCV